MSINLEKRLLELNENKLFELLKKRVFPNLVKTEEIFGRIDCFETKDKLHIELKCRYEHFPTMYIEKKKYIELIKKENSFYCCSTSKGIYLFDISNLEEPIWRIKYLPKTTEFTSNELVEKEIGELRIDKSIELTQLIFI